MEKKSEQDKKQSLVKDVSKEVKNTEKVQKVIMPEKEVKKVTKNVKKAVKKIIKKHLRSKKYQKTITDFNKAKFYNIEEAVDWVKKLSYSKFDGSFELHIRLQKKKNQEAFRKMIELPHGTGKKLQIVLLDEAKIDEIAKTKKINFDIALSTPELMPKVAKIARILGPKGKMPNPKSGTVTNAPQETIKDLESGKIEIKEENNGLIHQIIGKVSWDSKKIIENIQKILSQIPASQLKTVIICATMSPGVKIKLK